MVLLAATALVVGGCGDKKPKVRPIKLPAARLPPDQSAAPIRSIGCLTHLKPIAYSARVRLKVLDDGKPATVPALIGVRDDLRPRCYYWLNTRRADGVIRIEAPDRFDFTLGQFFDIWRQPLSRSRVASLTGPVRASIGKRPYTRDLYALPLRPGTTITLEVGKA